jgi:hypothetical protein
VVVLSWDLPKARWPLSNNRQAKVKTNFIHQ